MSKLIKRPNYWSKLRRFREGGQIPGFRDSGKLPIGNQQQYDHVISIYQSLIAKGVDPQAALDLTNQKIAEKGWSGWVSGDNKRYPNVNSFTDHLIDWHGRKYPNSLKVKNFDEFYEGVNGTREQHDRNRRSGGKDNSGRFYYNTERGYDGYREDLLKTRPGVKKRINHYRATQGLPPLVYQEVPEDPILLNNNDYLIT